MPALAQRAVNLVTTALMYLDDSSGIVGDDLHTLMAVHARACAATPPDPKRLATWLGKLRLDGPGWPDFKPRDYAAALGQKGQAELTRIAEDRAKTTEPDLLGWTPFDIRVLREQLAEISGDINHYIAELAEDLYAASSYLKIVDALRNVGRTADAERWAQRGLGIGNPIDQGKLRDTYVNLLLERDATTEAATMRWQLFDQHPTHTHYNDLRRTTERTGDWPGLRDKAIRRKAIEMLRKLRDAYRATGDMPGFGTYLDRLRDRHKRKTSFIAKLDRANL